MARAGVYLGSAGVLLALLAIALPHDPDLDETLLARRGRGHGLRRRRCWRSGSTASRYWAFHVLAAVGTLVASAAIYAWGAESLLGPLPYLWVTIYVFYFFPLQLALVHLASIGVAFAAVIAVEDPGYTPVGGWVATVGTLARHRRPDRGRADADGRPGGEPDRRRAPRPADRSCSTAAASRRCSTPSSSARGARTRSSA